MPERQRAFKPEEAEEPADAHPAPTAKRRRTWERRQRRNPETMQVTYRGIPRELNEQLKAVATAERVTVSEIARLFLEYALDAHQAGELTVETKAAAVKRTVDFGPTSGGE